jgi:hypothetical protein
VSWLRTLVGQVALRRKCLIHPVAGNMKRRQYHEDQGRSHGDGIDDTIPVMARLMNVSAQNACRSLSSGWSLVWATMVRSRHNQLLQTN